jgi:hypothetical protein
MSQPIPGAPAPDPRATRQAWKQARLQAIAAGRRLPTVRVLPASEEIRRVLRHPRAMAFRATGSVEWPRDSFTQRRLDDGSITIEAPHKAAPHPASAPKPPEA